MSSNQKTSESKQIHLISKFRKILKEFLVEWKKGNYYLEKNKEENIENWRNNPKEMALHKKPEKKDSFCGSNKIM